MSLFDLETHARRPRRTLRDMRALYDGRRELGSDAAAARLCVVGAEARGGAAAALNARGINAPSTFKSVEPASTHTHGAQHLSSPSAEAIVIDAVGRRCAGLCGDTPASCVDALLARLRAEGARLDEKEGRAWIERHVAHVGAKLLGYERAWPQLRGVALGEARVLHQLRYRYEREVVRNHRSVLRRIVEGDSHPSQLMVLLLGSTRVVAPTATGTGAAGARVALSDGWNSLDAQLDAALAQQLRRGRLAVGDKLMVSGCRLLTGEDGSPCLAVCANGARAARWDARLGLQRRRTPPHLPLHSLVPGGGAAPSVRVVVQRHYPMQFLEKRADGSRRVRCARLEVAESEQCAERYVAALEQWVDALRRAGDKSALGARDGAIDAAALPALIERELRSGADLAALLLALIQAHDVGAAARQLAQLDEEQLGALREACGGLRPPELAPPDRSITPFCRLALSDLATGALAELTVWRPPEHVAETVSYTHPQAH